MRIGGFIPLALCLVLVVGCARDGEDTVRARLEGWFFLGPTLYFNSEQRCTAAVFALEQRDVRKALPVQRLPEDARTAFRISGRTALRVADYSPNDLIDALLLTGDGALGKQALAAGSQGVACTKGAEAEPYFSAALTQVGATFVYDAELGGLIVLDPEQGRLFFIADDVW